MNDHQFIPQTFIQQLRRDLNWLQNGDNKEYMCKLRIERGDKSRVLIESHRPSKNHNFRYHELFIDVVAFRGAINMPKTKIVFAMTYNELINALNILTREEKINNLMSLDGKTL